MRAYEGFRDRGPGEDPFEVEILTTRGKNNLTYTKGEKIVFFLKVNRNAHVRIFNRGTDGEIYRIFPNDFHPDDRVPAGRAVMMPGKGYGNFTFEVRPPSGTRSPRCTLRIGPLRNCRGRLFRQVHTTVFGDHVPQQPYSADIEDALYDIRKAQPEDTVIVFLSGHGVTTRENDFLFITRDAKRRDDNTYRMGSVLKWRSIREVMNSIRARRIILLDTCHSDGVDMTDLAKKGYDLNMVVFASSKGSQTSQERKDLKNGYFTYAILKGLGKGLPADTLKDGTVEITELSGYVRAEVRKLTGKQTPTPTLPPGQDGFPFFGR